MFQAASSQQSPDDRLGIALSFTWESSHRTNRIKPSTSHSLRPAINILSEHFPKGLRVQECCKCNGNLSIYVNVTLYVPKSNMIFDIWGTSIFHYIYNNTFYLVGGEGNGNPLQYFCLENCVDRGAWWATAHGVAQSQTRLKRLSMNACTGEANGNPLQYSCPENPRDRGTWWAAVYEVAQSQTRLKWLSSSRSSRTWLNHIHLSNSLINQDQSVHPFGHHSGGRITLSWEIFY